MSGTVATRYVYWLHDEAGELLYVGSANDPRSRFIDHARTRPWWVEVHSATIEAFSNPWALAWAVETAEIRSNPGRYNLTPGSAARGWETRRRNEARLSELLRRPA